MVIFHLSLAFVVGVDDETVFTVEPPPHLRSLKSPVTQVRRGKDLVRTYVLSPGDSFLTPRGVRTWVRRVENDGVVFGRWSEWTVKRNAERVGHSTGSREKLYLLEIDASAKTVRFEVRTRIKLSWWEVMAF